MPSSSSPSTSKPTLLSSIRRLTPKLRRESMPSERPAFHVVEASTSLSRVATSTSSASRPNYSVTLTMAHESQGSSTPTDESSSASSSSVYCPPLAQPPSSPPKRRVRMSGSRLPSGYRPRPTHSPIPSSSSSTHTSASVPVCPQPGSASTPASDIPQPLRTRLTRFLHRHTSPSSFTMTITSTATPMTATPTSSILSFPSSSSRTTTTYPPTSASSPTGSRKHVRFSTHRVKEEKRARSLDVGSEGGEEKERAHLSDALARMSSPWKRATSQTHEGHAS